MNISISLSLLCVAILLSWTIPSSRDKSAGDNGYALRDAVCVCAVVPLSCPVCAAEMISANFGLKMRTPQRTIMMRWRYCVPCDELRRLYWIVVNSRWTCVWADDSLFLESLVLSFYIVIRGNFLVYAVALILLCIMCVRFVDRWFSRYYVFIVKINQKSIKLEKTTGLYSSDIIIIFSGFCGIQIVCSDM